ncbi:MAG: exosortase system-associated protein, TIGR04073 family [Candidatus Omnitrophota bacterium]|nr:exosortase system-associated protein, TIGR04073 family [Candidatus Omnitrophota bacterium]
MRKILLIAGLIFLLSVLFTTPAYCGDAIKKLGRGLCNVVTCPFELPLQISRVNNSEGPAAASTWGVLKGIGKMGIRVVVGVYEVATFPLPFPKDYTPILVDPEFFFEEENW